MILYNKAIYGHPIDLAELCPSGAGHAASLDDERRPGVGARLVSGWFPKLPASSLLPLYTSVAPCGGRPDDLFNLMLSSSEMIIVTTDTIQGFRIKQYLGLVRGTGSEPTLEPRRESTLNSSRNTDRDPPVKDQRDPWEKAFDKMRDYAKKTIKANAVIGVSYASYPKVSGNEFYTDTQVEIVCYGTAVVIEPE